MVPQGKIVKLNWTLHNKEAGETRYWIRLFRDSNIPDSKLAGSLLKDCEELIKLLTAIINTWKASQ